MRGELQSLARGEIQVDTLRYRLMLAAARAYLENPDFYSLNATVFSKFLDSMGPLKKKEVRNIILGIIKHSNNEKEASDKIIGALISVRIKAKGKKGACISPSVDESLYKKVVKPPYEAPFNPMWEGPECIFDFSSMATKEERKRQSKEERSWWDDVVHTRDAAHVVLSNPVQTIWQHNITTKANKQDKKPKKPTFSWEADFHQAVIHGDKKSFLYDVWLVPELINMPQDGSLDTAAHLAVANSQVELVDLLHVLGADFGQANRSGLLPVHLAHTPEMITALTNIGCDVNMRNANGECLLEIQSKHFSPDVIRKLLELGANILEPNPKGYYWMAWVIGNEYYGGEGFDGFQRLVRGCLVLNTTAPYNQNEIYREIIAKPLEQCAENDAKDLHAAVESRNIPRMNVLLALGALVDKPRDDGQTNLMYCIEKGDVEIAQILLANCAKASFTNAAGENTFRIAVRKKQWEVAKLLKKYGADINALAKDGLTVLHMCYKEKLTEAFNFCLEQGCNVNTPDASGRSVTFTAFLEKDDATGDMLRDKYCGLVNTQDKDGNTLIHLSVQQRDAQRVEYFRKKGVKLDTRNKIGWTPFMQSVMLGYSDISEVLLRLGADINDRDACSNTCLMLVCNAEPFNRASFDFLMSHGCDPLLENHDRNTAFGMLVAKKHDAEAEIIFQKPGFMVKAVDSIYEPIVVALKAGSQHWFERLVENGADGANLKFPVVETYLRCPFFKVEVLRQMKDLNLEIGAPFAFAMSMDNDTVAKYLWNVDRSPRVQMSRGRDAEGHNPLMIAIIKDWNFALELIDPMYDCLSGDKNGVTPYMMCFKYNRIIMIGKFRKTFEDNQLDVKDKDGNSPLTMAANAGHDQICESMFIKGCKLDCKPDDRGIVLRYRGIVEKYEKMRKQCEDDFKLAQLRLEEYDGMLRRVQQDRILVINRPNPLLEGIPGRLLTEEQKERMRQDDEREKAEVDHFIEELKENAATNVVPIFQEYQQRIQLFKQATRELMLHKMDTFVLLADRTAIQQLKPLPPLPDYIRRQDESRVRR